MRCVWNTLSGPLFQDMQLLRVHNCSGQMRISWHEEGSTLILRIVLWWIGKALLIAGRWSYGIVETEYHEMLF